MLRAWSSRATRRSRRGVALLWLAVAGIVVLLAWGLSRTFVTSSVRAQAEAGVEARLAESLADSAVAELEAQIGYQVNALDLPLNDLLIRQVLAGESGELDLAPFVRLSRIDALLAQPAYQGYSVDEWTARVAFQRQIDCIPYEKKALFVFTATVSSPGLVRKATRRLELARWAKITLTVPPRPFGNEGIFFVDATGLTDPDAVNRHRDRAVALCRQIRTALTNIANSASGPIQQSYRELLAKSFDPDAAPPNGVPSPLSLPAGATLYGLAETGSPQNLKNLDLAATMADLVEKAEIAQQAFLATTAQGAAPESPADPDSQLQSGRTALAAAIAVLTELWTFERTYTVVPHDAGAVWGNLRTSVYKLSDAYFRRRAHYDLEEKADRRDLNPALMELLDRDVQGVVTVGNTVGPVALSGSVRGRVIIVVGPGGATVRDLNSNDSSTGCVTLVASSGLIQIAGKNCINLVLVDPSDGSAPCQLRIDPDARIHGSLIATSLPSGDWRHGELDRDDRTYSGFTDSLGREQGLADRFFVGLSPRIFYRRVVRP